MNLIIFILDKLNLYLLPGYQIYFSFSILILNLQKIKQLMNHKLITFFLIVCQKTFFWLIFFQDYIDSRSIWFVIWRLKISVRTFQNQWLLFFCTWKRFWFVVLSFFYFLFSFDSSFIIWKCKIFTFVYQILIILAVNL